MDAGLHQLTLPQPRLQAVPTPKIAHPETLRLCATERDAMRVSIRLSGCTQAVIAKRIGVSKQALSKWIADGIPGGRVTAFCVATNSALLKQFIDLQRAIRQSCGVPREADRIAEIAKHSEAA